MVLDDRNPLTLILGLVVVVTSAITFGLFDIEILNNTLKPIAAWVFVGGFIMVYLISDRQLGKLKDYEGVALAIPIAIAILTQQVPEVEQWLTDYNPIAGFALLAITLASFYILGTNMELNAVAIELVLGATLLVTAGMQFGLVEIDLLNNHIADVTVWVFVITLAVSYFVSERSIGTMNNFEVGALALGIGSYLAYEYIPAFTSYVNSSEWQVAVGLTAIVGISFAILANHGEVPEYADIR